MAAGSNLSSSFYSFSGALVRNKRPAFRSLFIGRASLAQFPTRPTTDQGQLRHRNAPSHGCAPLPHTMVGASSGISKQTCHRKNPRLHARTVAFLTMYGSAKTAKTGLAATYGSYTYWRVRRLRALRPIQWRLRRSCRGIASRDHMACVHYFSMPRQGSYCKFALRSL